jgi:RNA polymerase sigma factor (sigma-70 family)
VSNPGNAHDPANPSSAPRDDATPAWLHSQGILGNEERFARQFLPLVQKWARAEIKRVGQLGRLDPDDFAQDVILKVFARFRAEPFVSTTGQGGFHAYLRRAVHNAVVDALRAADAAYQGKHLEKEEWDEVTKSIDSLADCFSTAWAQDMARLREAVDRVQKRVGAVRWEAFRLTVVEGCKGAEVAARLGLSPSQVYNARHDIAAYLREELTALGYEG